MATRASATTTMPPRRTRSSQVRLGFSPFWLPFPPPGPPPPPLPEADRACRRSLRVSGAPASGLSRSAAEAPAAASGRDEPKNDSPVWSPRGAPRPGTGTPLMGVDGASRASPFDGGRVGDGGGGPAGVMGSAGGVGSASGGGVVGGASDPLGPVGSDGDGDCWPLPFRGAL